jgi:hypothetical protein
MKHAVKHIHFVGPQAAQRRAVVISAGFAAEADEGARS